MATTRVLSLTLLLALASALLSAPAHAQSPADGLRDELSGFTTVPGGPEAGVLVQQFGRGWRQLRNGPVQDFGGWTLAAVLLAIAAFFAWRGRVRLVKGRSGRRIPRWSLFERTLHWLVALLFIALALTGFSLLLGRPLLIPWLGHSAFGAYAQYALWLHNFIGPVFALALAVMIVIWFQDNLLRRVDWVWFRQGGGIVFKDRHPSAERMNGGEKVWFWLLCTVGLAVVVSGLVMDFPIFGQSRATMQTANLIHSALSVIWTAAFFGHAYIGSIGMEGAFEGMVDGRVDAHWAEQHHDIWYRRKQSRSAPEDDRPLQAKPIGEAATDDRA